MAHTLSPREKQFLIIGGAVGAVLLVLVLLVIPFQDRMRSMDQKIQRLETQVEEAQMLRARYMRLKQQLTGSETKLKQGQKIDFFQYVTDLANAQVAPEQQVYIREKPEPAQEDFRVRSLEVRFQQLDLGQVVRVLSRLETAPTVIRVKSLSVKKRFDNPELLDLELAISSYSPA